MRYLARSSNGYYSFRIRIPNAYRIYFNQTEIVKALKTKSYNEARKLCKLITAETLKLLQTLRLGIFDKAQEKLLVEQYLSKVLTKDQQATGQIEVLDLEKVPLTPTSTLSQEETKIEEGKKLSEIVEIYHKNIPHTTSLEQKKAYKAFFNDMFFELIDKNSLIKDIDREKLLEIKEIIQGLPKRNITKYRNMKISKIVTRLDKIKDEEKIAIKTVNDYLKWIMSLFSFAQKYGYVEFNPAIDLKFKLKSNAKEQRETFSDNELRKFIELNNEDENIKMFHYTFFYTGMINSEFLQAKITDINGVLCFDLTDPNLNLKTLSRHRIIPIHSHLLDLGIVEKLSYIQKNYTSDYLSKISNKFIKKHVSNSSKKVLYSFRHTFATKLQNNMIEEAVIAQLMGHSKIGMTFGRYAKGYVTDTLKKAIESLKFPLYSK